MTHGIGLPPILALGSDEMKRRIAPEVLSGDKIIGLAITEAIGGFGRRATEDQGGAGRQQICRQRRKNVHHFSGMRADYLTVAVRTGGPGMAGISLILIETDRPGVTRTRLDKMGWRCSDTAAIHFDGVEVPPENLIGPENSGFLRNHEEFQFSERLGMAMGCCAMARVALAEAVGVGDDPRNLRQAPGAASVDPHQAGRLRTPDRGDPGVGRPVRVAVARGQGPSRPITRCSRSRRRGCSRRWRARRRRCSAARRT